MQFNSDALNNKTQFHKLFSSKKVLLGMIHVQALPGTPNAKYSINKIVDLALSEAKVLAENGYQGLIIENMHDIPYCKNHRSPEIVASMTAVARQIKQSFKLPLGIQVLAAANESALSVALASEADFIRVEGFVYGHIADEGYIESCAGSLLRYRKQIGAEHIAVYADIKKKHSAHAITSDVNIIETAKAAEFFLADGLIITGQATGSPVELKELTSVYENVSLPILIGSGLNYQNLKDYFPHADAFIVGSSLKQQGHWANSLDHDSVKQLADTFNQLCQ